MKPPPPKKSFYNKGDFIARNIVLGGDARFYHALTEDEQSRIDSLVEQDEGEPASNSLSLTQLHDSFTHVNPFSPNTMEVNKLIEIDKFFFF